MTDHENRQGWLILLIISSTLPRLMNRREQVKKELEKAMKFRRLVRSTVRKSLRAEPHQHGEVPKYQWHSMASNIKAPWLLVKYHRMVGIPKYQRFCHYGLGPSQSAGVAEATPRGGG